MNKKMSAKQCSDWCKEPPVPGYRDCLVHLNQIGFWDRKDEIWLIECTDGSRRFRSGNTGRAWGKRLDLTFGDLP